MTSSKEHKQELPGIGVSDGNLVPDFPVGGNVAIPINRLYFIMTTDGEGTVEVDGQEFYLHKGSFLYLLPNHLLTLRNHSTGFRTCYAGLTFDLLSDFPLLLKADISDYVGNHPCCELCRRDYLTLGKYYDLLSDRYRSEQAGMEIIKGILYSFILEVNRIYSGRNTGVQVTHQDKITDGFFQLLHRHFVQERSAAFYAGKLCVSDKHLMRVIKQKTGHTFHFWLTDFLLRQAKLMLLSTDMNITQVAESMHFPSSSAFARFFRKGTGLPPVQYRQRHNEKARILAQTDGTAH